MSHFELLEQICRWTQTKCMTAADTNVTRSELQGIQRMH